MSEARDFKGIWISKDIWLNKDLSAIDKIVFAEIDSLDNEEHCSASNEYFAEFCQVSVPTVSRSIKKLIDLGLVEVISFDGRHRIMKVVIKQTNQIDKADLSKCSSNNIDNNINNKNLIKNKTGRINHLIESSSIVDSKPKKRTGSLYSKCEDEILSYTNNAVLISSLTEYLKFRLQVKDKPLYHNQWRGMLNKLAELTKGDVQQSIDIVNKALEKGWLSFYPITNNNGYLKQTCCEENVTSDTMTSSDYEALEKSVEERKNQGKRVDF